MDPRSVRSVAQAQIDTEPSFSRPSRLGPESRQFVKLGEHEIRRVLPRLTGRQRAVYTAIRFLVDGWADPPRLRARRIAEVASVPLRSCQLAIDELIDRGVVRREGAAQSPVGCRYSIAVGIDQNDRSYCDRFDRSGGGDTLLPSRSISSRSLPTPPAARARPAVSSSAPTEACKLVDLETARMAAQPFGSSWLGGEYVRRCLQRMVKLPSGADLARFAAHELATSNASRADYPPGVVFHPVRLRAWLERREKRRGGETPQVETAPPTDGARRVLEALGGRP